MKSLIVVTDKKNKKTFFSSIKKACMFHPNSYYTIRYKNKFPFVDKDLKYEKVKIKATINNHDQHREFLLDNPYEGQIITLTNI